MYTEFKTMLESIQENPQYEEYLTQHIDNVQKGYQWLKEHLPEIVSEDNCINENHYYGDLDEIIQLHDRSKYRKLPETEAYYDLTCEYDAYANYFYGKNKTKEVKESFNYAWLAHIHANPHHWQHWMLQNDEDGLTLLDMPYVFQVEMICDWWAFSWKAENLYEIFSWYEKNKNGILLSDNTRTSVEYILSELKKKLDEVTNDV